MEHKRKENKKERNKRKRTRVTMKKSAIIARKR